METFPNFGERSFSQLPPDQIVPDPLGVVKVLEDVMQRAKAMIPILVPLFISAFMRAEELAMAMEAMRIAHFPNFKSKGKCASSFPSCVFLCSPLPMSPVFTCQYLVYSTHKMQSFSFFL